MKNLKWAALCTAILFFGSCLSKYKYHISNPINGGKTPAYTPERILLGELTPVRESFDVTYYNLDIRIDPASKTVGGWVETKAIATTAIDSVQLDLDSKLQIQDIRWDNRDGLSLKYSRLYRAIFIQLPEKVEKGRTFSIYINYSGKPGEAKQPPWKGGLVWKKDTQKHDWASVACESNGTSVWFPGKDHTSDEPDSVDLRFTIPDSGLSVISNGILRDTQTSASLKTFHWKVSYPINLYDITFYMGDYVTIADQYKGITGKDLSILYCPLKINEEKAKVHFKQVKEHIRVFEELFGEYPWYNDGFKLVESPYRGMEHQTAIAYGNKYTNGLFKLEDYIILHETAHEWWGNAVTVSDLADAWIQEGFATYSEALYLEKKYGKELSYQHLLNMRSGIRNKRPVTGIYGRRDFGDNSDMYYKGAWMLHTLRYQIKNDSVFFDILKTFYQKYKYKITDAAAFTTLVNEKTNTDYTWFFDQYLRKRETPLLIYYCSKDGFLYCQWRYTNPSFNKLKVPLVNARNETIAYVYPSDKITAYKLDPQFAPYYELKFSYRYALFEMKKKYY